jgi:hypothetical protein
VDRVTCEERSMWQLWLNRHCHRFVFDCCVFLCQYIPPVLCTHLRDQASYCLIRCRHGTGGRRRGGGEGCGLREGGHNVGCCRVS